MAERKSNSKDEETLQPRKKYERPELKVYGQLTLLTQSSPPVGPGDGGTRRNRTSDSRLKTSIMRVGDHPSGVGLYAFEYRAEFKAALGEGLFVGVMAQEVETVCPDAVSLDEAGYRVVDYAKLTA